MEAETEMDQGFFAKQMGIKTTPKFKFCANCNTRAGVRQRKCQAPYCRGDVFRCATDEEIKAETDRREDFERLVRQLTE